MSKRAATLLSVSDLSLTRGGRRLVHGLDFGLEVGRITVVLGPNGAGKSTLLLALAGMLEADAGRISLNGKDIGTYGRRELADMIAWQGEMPPTEFGLTVEQRLHLAMRSGLDSEAGRQRRLDALEALDLSPLRARSLGELSGGERQRVELAAMLVRDCPLWLLDEPCTHLDIRHQVAWLDIMRSQARAGRAILAVLHDVQQAIAIAHDVILIYGDGRVAFGTADALLKPEVLDRLFATGLKRLGDRVLVPDYHGGESSAGL
jgi:iron complex transport system ATP-binding protein